MATENQNSKKILCCTGAVMKEAIASIDSTVGLNYISAASSLVEEIAFLIDSDIGFESNEDVTKGVILACGCLADAMGLKADSGLSFTTGMQSVIDSFTDAAEAISLVK